MRLPKGCEQDRARNVVDMSDKSQPDVSSIDEKQDTLGSVVYRYSSSWTRRLESEAHWRLYWHQQKLMEGLVKAGDSVLEIGVGTGFTANYLRSKGFTVATLDIDADKLPDIVANVVSYEFPDRYDHVLAFEVFEHIPYEEFSEVVRRVRVRTGARLFLSVPINEKEWGRLSWKLPGMKGVEWSWRRKKGRIVSGHHHWELKHLDYSMERLAETVNRAGYGIERSFDFQFRQFVALKPQ